MKTAALVAVSIWASAGIAAETALLIKSVERGDWACAVCAVAAIPITAACVFVMWRDYKWNR